MIDLTKKSLPNTVNVGGKDFSIYTDFRKWMKFMISVSKMKKNDFIDVSYLFKNEKPEYCPIGELLSFARPKNELPRPIKRSDVIAIDYEIDSDLILSAFWGQYGIDLTEVEELHWHKFLALLNGLNGTTRLREVMGYRCYEKTLDKNKDIYEELRIAWAIEPPLTEEEQEEIDKFNKLFGG